MSSKVPLPHSSLSSDPALLKVTEAITGTNDAKAASGIADMLLIFLSAAGTILGALLVAMVYVMATASRAHTSKSIPKFWFSRRLQSPEVRICNRLWFRPMGLEKRTSAAEAVERAVIYGTAEPVPFVKCLFPICLKSSPPNQCGTAKDAKFWDTLNPSPS